MITKFTNAKNSIPDVRPDRLIVTADFWVVTCTTVQSIYSNREYST